MHVDIHSTLFLYVEIILTGLKCLIILSTLCLPILDCTFLLCIDKTILTYFYDNTHILYDIWLGITLLSTKLSLCKQFAYTLLPTNF